MILCRFVKFAESIITEALFSTLPKRRRDLGKKTFDFAIHLFHSFNAIYLKYPVIIVQTFNAILLAIFIHF